MMSALPGFYQTVGLEAEPLERLVLTALDSGAIPHQEIRVFASAELPVAALYIAHPAAHLAARTMGEPMALARALPIEAQRAFLSRLREFSGQLPRVPETSYYLSRIAVRSELRGGPVSGEVMTDLWRESMANGQGCSLHVERDNARAVSFYLKHGFEEVTSTVTSPRYRVFWRSR